MSDRRQFLASLTATGCWLADPALATSRPQIGAVPIEVAVHWIVDADQPVALHAVSRMARFGEPIHALPGPIEPVWVRHRLDQALIHGAPIAGVASMADAFVLCQLVRDSGWRVMATQVAPTAGTQPTLYSWRFRSLAKDLV